ncbi:hypothetical protein GC101_18070 [Paenibacillus sp. LMG 31459]|uniref:Bacterial type II secretion system protein E domain-containing protein n=1 Tax=Paenibacillus phytohabitans TaxID=2654978 RepID=A0ABX1YIC1_9BACL|nr:ATPase, T2SS/T4P/T4SS family [Paenibacillus phytohabitans]NOU80772.1 hypothetical protein [Paenibacillus phytohabitans]
MSGIKPNNRTIMIANPGGGDTIEQLLKIIGQLPKNSKSIIVEFPCLGIPRIAYSLGGDAVKLEKERTMDQLLMDFDRNEPTEINEYIYKKKDSIDYILMNPRSNPENPVTRRINSNRSLIELPLYLKTKLSKLYDYVFFVSQGAMIHPATLYGIKVADAIVFCSVSEIEFVNNYTFSKKCNEVFGIEKNRLIIFSATNQLQSNNLVIYTKYSEVAKRITEVELNVIDWSPRNFQSENETIGLIDPMDHLSLKYYLREVKTELSDSEMKNIDSLTDRIRNLLAEKYLDDYVSSLTNEDKRQKIKYLIADMVRSTTDISFSMPISEVIEIIQKEITELGVLQEILDNPQISSIEINAPDQVIAEINGKDVHVEHIKFQNTEHLIQTIDKMLMPIGKPLSSNEPIIDANYRGFRICAVADNKYYSGVSGGHPLISIRKFPPNVYSDDECVDYGNISWEATEFLRFAIGMGANTLVAGGTNSGKTAKLLMFPQYVPKITRIISIEDSEELMYASKLQYKDYPNLPSLLVKNIEDKNKSYGIGKLVKATLRLKPSVLAVGEIRDEEAATETLIAMNTGHIIWTTIHANSAAEAGVRLLQLNGNTSAAAAQIAGSLDIILFQKRSKRTGVRVLMEISELIGYKGTEEPILNTIFKYNPVTQVFEHKNKIKSRSFLEKIISEEPPEKEFKRWCEVGIV